MDSLKATPRQIIPYIETCIQAGLVPYVRSSPGMGKSSLMRGVSNTFSLWMMDHRLSTSTPEDLSGLPRFQKTEYGDVATFVPFDMFPVEGTPLPPNCEGWMIFLDEFNSGSKAVQAAAYKLVLDKMVGQRKLHERVVITAAGNLDTDRAIVNPLSTAMQSRVVHLELMLSHMEWLEDVALKEKYNNKIISYLNYKTEHLMDFRPDHNDKTFCCPRTWEFMNRIVSVPGHVIEPKNAPLYGGTITSGVAASFVSFCEIYDKLPSFQTIYANPETAEVPADRQICWATVGHLMEYTSGETLEKLALYIARLPSDFQILFYRGLMVRQPDLRKHPAFRKSMVNLARYFHESPYFKDAA